ncbi:hypothetical protein GCM10010387_66660 [Streptomyces inusitatus]|uniref:LamG-like jellyroll fold domain-containing protein n=1 Tax=Streptomyces inusitatus TaxID=68221 RepID=A0A918QNV7_9ACTN|nr:LamG domain-containing protein [Streptomyces inusitatus]GGZ64052.1 hypothetical protein GCM10010387_66660 [Streptomyces inusitatus]
MSTAYRLRAAGTVLSAVMLATLSVPAGAAHASAPGTAPITVPVPKSVEGRWKFTGPGGTPATTPDDSARGRHMSLHNGVVVDPPAGWVDGAVVLDGVDDYGTTPLPVDTSSSFTFAVWAKAPSTPSGPVTLLSLPGAHGEALSLRYEPGADPATDPGRWRASVADRDDSAASPVTVTHGGFYSVTEWTHLAVVHDSATRQLFLYVNGGLEDRSHGGEPDRSWTGNAGVFPATQPLQLGRGRTAPQGWGAHWSGVVSDLWAFQGALSDAQVSMLAVGQPGLPTTMP